MLLTRPSILVPGRTPFAPPRRPPPRGRVPLRRRPRPLVPWWRRRVDAVASQGLQFGPDGRARFASSGKALFAAAGDPCCCLGCADCGSASATATVTLAGLSLGTVCQGPCAVGISPITGTTQFAWWRVEAGTVNGTYGLTRTLSNASFCRWEGHATVTTMRVSDVSFFDDCDTLPGFLGDPAAGDTFTRRYTLQTLIVLLRDATVTPHAWKVSAGQNIAVFDSFDAGDQVGGSYYYAFAEADCTSPPSGLANTYTSLGCSIVGAGGTATVSFP